MQYKIWGWRILKQLGNLTFSIILLLIIATISIIGTVIEQDHNIEYYQNKYPVSPTKLFNFSWRTIKQFNLDHLYTSGPFLILLLIFSSCLIICTFSTQLPSLRNARRWKFKKELPLHRQLLDQKFNKIKNSSLIIYYLNSIKYYIFYQSSYVYAYKGLQGKLAPIFVHISLILLLLGSLVSLFTSFYVQEMVPVGETFSMQNIIKAGMFSSIPTNISGKVNDFRIEYYKERSIKQFYSSIAITNNQDKHSKQQIISVNTPLYFQGLTIYQTDWTINGIKVEINRKRNIQIPLIKLNKNNQNYWFVTLQYGQHENYSFLLSSIDGKVSCYNKKGQLIKELQIKQQNTINYIPIRITNVISSTGLQIKQDYGIIIIYLSLAILMISTTMSYLSYSQIWIIVKKNRVILSGITNRAEISFEEEVLKLQKILLRNYHI
jgi:cytochrome c biogenesis protein